MIFVFFMISSSLPIPQKLLEVSTRPFLYQLSQQYQRPISKLRDIPDEIFEQWKEKGYDFIWFMGVWQLGEKGLIHDQTDPSLLDIYSQKLPDYTIDDIIGSPYSIVKYDLNIELGTESDLIWLRQKLNSFNLKLFLDFVPNHSALDAPEINSSRNFYVQCPKDEVINTSIYTPDGIAFGCGKYCDPWTDVAQFNYCDKDFIQHQITVLKKISQLADGCRCDMAHLILTDNFWPYWQTQLSSYGYHRPPSEFWFDAISAVKKIHPNFVFMAECYSDSLEPLSQLGFDYVYEKESLDNLQDHNIGAIKYRVFNSKILEKFAHFTENHDEPRAMSVFWNYAPAVKSASAALLTLPGMRFF